MKIPSETAMEYATAETYTDIHNSFQTAIVLMSSWTPFLEVAVSCDLAVHCFSVFTPEWEDVTWTLHWNLISQYESCSHHNNENKLCFQIDFFSPFVYYQNSLYAVFRSIFTERLIFFLTWSLSFHDTSLFSLPSLHWYFHWRGKEGRECPFPLFFFNP